MPLMEQLPHQKCVILGPLVLENEPLKIPAPTVDKDRTVSRRSEPSSRTALTGEQPDPWDLLQPQDAMSRHRGAKPVRRCELLEPISLLSLAYLLSVERWQFHIKPSDHFGPAFASARLVGLTVNLAYTHTLDARLPTVLSQASRSSVTLWEETAPVKLTRKHCPSPG